MLIESLKMVDFRQFKGEVTLNFSRDEKKNVTVILGDNTFGKTTLLQAFNWCFYDVINLPHNEMVLNLEVVKSMPQNVDRKVSVEVTFEHQKIHYTIMRSRTYCKIGEDVELHGSSKSMSYKTQDGQTNIISDYQTQDVINEILPEELSSYFFFDTERVQEVSERSDLAAAVRGLLGLSVLENAKKHLGSKDKKTSVIGQFYSDLAKVGNDENMEQVMALIHNREVEKTACRNRIDVNKRNIQSYEKQVEQLDKALAKGENTRKLQEVRKKMKKDITKEKSFLDKSKIRLRTEISHRFMDFFSEPYIDSALRFLKTTKVEDKGIKGLTAQTLKELLTRGVCVCGCKLDKGSAAYQHVLDEINYVPPASIGTIVRNYMEDLKRHRQTDHGLDSIEACFSEIYSHADRINKWTDEIGELSRQISGQENMEKYENDRRNAKAQLNRLRADNINQEKKDTALTKDMEIAQKYIDTHAGDSDKSRKIRTMIAYAESLVKWIQEAYGKSESEIRYRLLQEVNKIFQEMYTGERKVEIDEKYHVRLLANVDGEYVESGESEGLRRVKNFAFIGGLVALAKDRIVANAGEEELDLSSEPYPLVMDAPFSNADAIHTANISKVLPEVAEQVIMFVMQKDWNYAKKVMDNRVGARYQLQKINDVHTVLEEV